MAVEKPISEMRFDVDGRGCVVEPSYGKRHAAASCLQSRPLSSAPACHLSAVSGVDSVIYTSGINTNPFLTPDLRFNMHVMNQPVMSQPVMSQPMIDSNAIERLSAFTAVSEAASATSVNGANPFLSGANFPPVVATSQPVTSAVSVSTMAAPVVATALASSVLPMGTAAPIGGKDSHLPSTIKLEYFDGSNIPLESFLKTFKNFCTYYKFSTGRSDLTP